MTLDREKNILRNILRMPRKITKIKLRWHLDSWGILMSVTSSKHLGISTTKQQNQRDVQITIKKHTVVIYTYHWFISDQLNLFIHLFYSCHYAMYNEIKLLSSGALSTPTHPNTQPTPNLTWHTHAELSNWCKCLTSFSFILFLLFFIWRLGRFYILQLSIRNWSKIQNSLLTRFGFT